LLLDQIGDHLPKDLSTLRTIRYAGSPISATRLEQCLDVFGPVFLQSYGNTEAKGGLTFLSKRDHLQGGKVLASCGRPSLLAELRILDADGRPCGFNEPGELTIRGPSVFKEYWRQPEATAAAFTEDGWYRSGDIAKIDDRGYVYLLDRKEDMIVTGGLNVYPNEIEQVLMSHELIAEGAVFGVPDSKWGESVSAIIRIREGSQLPESAIKAWLRTRLPAHQIPKNIEVVNYDLPRNASGKVLRRAVREPYWQDKDRQIN
jgi:acyl-CoA synthetase (AMP-forming)/AMP-acid ligase II